MCYKYWQYYRIVTQILISYFTARSLLIFTTGCIQILVAHVQYMVNTK